MTQIRLQGVTKIYLTGKGRIRAVDDVSLLVEDGEFFFLLGPSGCGKTTLLRIIAGLIEPTAGRIRFGERDVTDLPPEKRNTAMVFQSYALWPHMTVGQNVEFAPKMRGTPERKRRDIVAENLGRVELQGFEKRKPNQLSGGQQQRVAVARALAARADCLLMDEPLSNLDARLRMHMRGQLRRLVKSAGCTAIYVTHDQKEALCMADRIGVMNDGRIVQIGRPEEIYNRPETRFVADFLGEGNFLHGTVVMGGKAARIDTPVGLLFAEPTGSLSVGAKVTCCIRPERVRIAALTGQGGQAGRALLPAAVISEMYLGELRQLSCRLANGDVWKVYAMSAGTPAAQAGQAVGLSVDAADVILLPEERPE